jgi:aspartyl-tRNA(Asn)/glutamyl-tRNA(Gln) amidotransferase subunit A
MDPEVEAAIHEAVRVLERLGAVQEKVSLPHTDYAVATYYLVATAEASSNLERYDGVKYGYRTARSDHLIDMYMKTRREGFGPEVKRRIMLGTYALSAGYYDAYYLKALRVRTLIRQDFTQAFKRCDVIVTPTSPTPAFKFGDKTDDPLQMYLSDIFTISGNLAGVPGVSVNCGFTRSGLPMGLQIIGKPFDEETILKVAHAYEQATSWHSSGAALARPGRFENFHSASAKDIPNQRCSMQCQKRLAMSRWLGVCGVGVLAAVRPCRVRLPVERAGIWWCWTTNDGWIP